MTLELLEGYGELLFAYHGHGALRYEHSTIPCSFQAAQLESGRNILVCYEGRSPSFPLFGPPPISFQGTCDDGGVVTSSGPVTQTNELHVPPLEPPSFVDAFYLRQLEWRAPSASEATVTARAHLTNLDFFSFRGSPFGYEYPRVLELLLPATSTGIQLFLGMTSDHEQVLRRLHTVRGTGVTAHALVGLPLPQPTNLDEILRVLCYVVSVARGTRVQAICVEYLDSTGAALRREHSARITKPYSPLAMIDPRAGHHLEFADFVTQGYAAFLEREQSFELPLVVDSLLDAKLQEDFLEMRGAKLAVTLETLKHSLTRALSPDGEFIVPPNTFEQLIPALLANAKTAGITAGLPAPVLDVLFTKEKLTQLNRRSFRWLIRQLARHLDMNLSNAETTAFINSRNSLVHNGRFFCQQDPDSGTRPFEEYTADVYFLDRIFARLLGWRGSIIDWRDPSGDTHTAPPL